MCENFFGSDRHYRTLDEILLPTEKEVGLATAKYMKRYDELVAEFKEKTALTGLDLSVLTFCAGLQVLRWAILSNERLKFDSAAQADKLVKGYLPESVYDVVAGPVPYDAIQRSGQFMLKYPGESVGISGANHRFKTLGHDPLAVDFRDRQHRNKYHDAEQLGTAVSVVLYQFCKSD